jgi:hypothetical protein
MLDVGYGLKNALYYYADKSAVADLIHRRASGADRFDVELMRDCHAPHARESHGKFDGVADEFIDNLVKADPGSACLGKSHNVSNILSVRRGDNMFVESYHVVRETFAAGDEVEERRVGYRYLDTCAQDDGQWRFICRETVNEWAWRTRRLAQAHTHLPPRGMSRGTRLADDPLYRLQQHARGSTRARMRIAPTRNVSADDQALKRLLDKQAITEVCWYVARALDRDDRVLALACATDDWVFAHLPDFAASHDDMTFHFVTNVLIEFSDDDRASVQSNFVRWSAPAHPVGERLHKVSGGRYLDSFRRSAGQWLIARRDVLNDWNRAEAGQKDYWASYASHAGKTGVRGPSDPLYDYCERGIRPNDNEIAKP